jgi:hypothetical protein
MDEVKYGIIHEVGEYQGVQPLSEQDNKFVNEQDKKENNDSK